MLAPVARRPRPNVWGCSPPEGNFTEEQLPLSRSTACWVRLELQSPGGEFHGGTPSPNAEGAVPRTPLQSPGGEFHGGTQRTTISSHGGSPPVAVPRRGISRRNLGSSAKGMMIWKTSCSPPEGNFTEERLTLLGLIHSLSCWLQSPGGEFHGGTEDQGQSNACSGKTVAVPRRGISRRNWDGRQWLVERVETVWLQSPGGEFHGGTISTTWA